MRCRRTKNYNRPQKAHYLPRQPKYQFLHFLFSFSSISNINIYSDSYSIISDENNITLDILLNKGTDSNNNIILFYNLSKIIPLKFNDLYLEDNIYSLCNYILKKELSSL